LDPICQVSKTRAKELRQLELDEGTVWTQIRSFIKGSEHAVRCERPLLKEEYTDETLLPLARCSLKADQREAAFEIYRQYTGLMQDNANKRCEAEGCLKRPVFGVDGEEPVCCMQHKEDGHVRSDSFIGECLFVCGALLMALLISTCVLHAHRSVGHR
jgi:hypothetical protein